MKISKISTFAVIILAILLLAACSGNGNYGESSAFSMGSVVTVKTYSSSKQAGEQARADVIKSIEALDGIISKNSEQSELFKVNEASGSEIEISRELFDIIEASEEIFSLSRNKAAVTSGALTQLWGIDTESFNVPSEDEIKANIPLCNDSLLVLDRRTLTLKVNEGQIINLGAVGKGAACDKAVDRLLSYEEIDGAVVSVGGSLALYGKPSGKDNWSIGIRNPFGTVNDSFATLSLSSGFVSTSGSYEKTFEVDGVTYHHLIDLTTGKPSENELCSVTVIAHSGLESDALSTVCYLIGETASYPLLSRYNAQAVFVYSDKTVSVTDGISDYITITDSDFTVV